MKFEEEWEANEWKKYEYMKYNMKETRKMARIWLLMYEDEENIFYSYDMLTNMV